MDCGWGGGSMTGGGANFTKKKSFNKNFVYTKVIMMLSKTG